MNVKKMMQISSQNNCASWGLLFIRVVAGVAFAMHGWGKIQNPMAWMGPDAPVPGFLQLLAAVSEFGGGIALALGLLTNLALIGMMITMAVAIHFHAIVQGDPFMSQGGPSWEMAALYFSIFLSIFCTGPGKYSLDSKVFGFKN